MKRVGNKRSQSTVIATVLIIVLVIVLVGMVAAIILNFVKQSTTGVCLDKFSLDLSIDPDHTIVLADNSIQVAVSRGQGSGSIQGMKIIFTDSSGNSASAYEDGTLNEVSSKVYTVDSDTTSGLGTIKTISIAPKMICSNGQSAQADILASLNLENTNYQVPPDSGNPCTMNIECMPSQICNETTHTCLFDINCQRDTHKCYGGKICRLGVCVDSGGPGCTPDCAGRSCGDIDGCGGTCNGICPSGRTCISGVCVNDCVGISCFDDDLIIHYSFDGGSATGVVEDSSGNNLDANIFGSLTSINYGIQGSKAYNFDGTNVNYIKKSGLDLSSYTNGLSVIVWFRNPQWDSLIFSLGSFPTETIFSNINNAFSFRYSGPIGSADWFLNSLFKDKSAAYTDYTGSIDNNWHSAVMTYDYTSQTGKLYLDGVYKSMVSSVGITPSSLSNLHLRIGKGMISGTNYVFNSPLSYKGDIDDFRMYNRVFSDDDISTLVVGQSCIDTDVDSLHANGINPYTYGSVSLDGGITDNLDTCTLIDGSGAHPSTIYLSEAYCDGSTMKFSQIDCPNGCSLGVCRSSTCVDSDTTPTYLDGKNIELSGYLTPDGGTTKNLDTCSYSDSRQVFPSSQYLMEGYCDDGGAMKFLDVFCPNGCSDRACLPKTCTDGVCSQNFVHTCTSASQYKTCLDYNLDGCREWSNSLIGNLDCASGSCSSSTGLCTPTSSTESCNGRSIVCSDGQRRGDLNGDGSVNDIDLCLYSKVLSNEVAVPSNGLCCLNVNNYPLIDTFDKAAVSSAISGGTTNSLGRCSSCASDLDCPTGLTCFNNICAAITTTPLGTIVPTCTDSDTSTPDSILLFGQNYNVAGTVNGFDASTRSIKSFSDRCLSGSYSNYLREFYCSSAFGGIVMSINFDCRSLGFVGPGDEDGTYDCVNEDSGGYCKFLPAV